MRTLWKHIPTAWILQCQDEALGKYVGGARRGSWKICLLSLKHTRTSQAWQAALLSPICARESTKNQKSSRRTRSGIPPLTTESGCMSCSGTDGWKYTFLPAPPRSTIVNAIWKIWRLSSTCGGLVFFPPVFRHSSAYVDERVYKSWHLSLSSETGVQPAKSAQRYNVELPILFAFAHSAIVRWLFWQSSSRKASFCSFENSALSLTVLTVETVAVGSGEVASWRMVVVLLSQHPHVQKLSWSASSSRSHVPKWNGVSSDCHGHGQILYMVALPDTDWGLHRSQTRTCSSHHPVSRLISDPSQFWQVFTMSLDRHYKVKIYRPTVHCCTSPDCFAHDSDLISNCGSD